MKCVTYRRVSTEMQSEEGFSLEAQKSRLLSYIESQGWELIEDYADEGASAKNIERPALQRMLNDMKSGKFEVILVYRLDRLVRSVTDLHTLLSEFEKNNVKFKSATEVFDTTSAMGRLFITMVGAMAQWERENLAERVTMGMLKRHEEGQRNGAKAPYGYDLGDDGDLVVNEEEAKWVRYIFDAYKTKGRKYLATDLNRKGIKTKSGTYWSEFSILYLVSNPVYTGKLRWGYRKVTGEKTENEVIVEGNHEAIVSDEVYEKAQEARKSRKGAGYRADTPYPYTGVLRCSRCGKTMIGAKKPRKDGYHRFYKCVGRFKYGICDMPIIPESVIDDYLSNEMNFSAYKDSDDYAETAIDENGLLKELEKVKRAISRTFQAYQWGDIESDKEYRALIDPLKEREKEINLELKSVKGGSISNEILSDVIRNIKDNWSLFTLEEKKEFISNSFAQIVIDITEEVKGGPGHKPKIEIKDYAWL